MGGNGREGDSSYMYIHTCTIDVWAFKGTAMGTYPMYHSEDLEVAQ